MTLDKAFAAVQTTYEDPVPVVFITIALFATFAPAAVAYLVGYYMHHKH